MGFGVWDVGEKAARLLSPVLQSFSLRRSPILNPVGRSQGWLLGLGQRTDSTSSGEARAGNTFGA